MDTIEEILINKLNNKEIHDLVTKHDRGLIDWNKLLKRDKANYPQCYVDTEE